MSTYGSNTLFPDQSPLNRSLADGLSFAACMLPSLVGLRESNRLLLYRNSANLRNPLSLSSKILFDRQIAAGRFVSQRDSSNKGLCTIVALDKTPHYVLRAGALIHEPSAVWLNPDPKTNAIFGFSDKPQYDRFLANSTVELTPYPLVRIFLQDLLDLKDLTLRLVILDPTTCNDSEWRAASFERVLDAIVSRSEFLKASHSLTRQANSMEYHIERLDT